MRKVKISEWKKSYPKRYALIKRLGEDEAIILLTSNRPINKNHIPFNELGIEYNPSECETI